MFHNVKSSSLSRGFLLTAVGSGISKVLLVLLTFICARSLSQEDFGTFSFLRNTLQMFFSICALNFCNLCTKFSAESLESEVGKRRLFILIFVSFSLCCIVGWPIAFSSETVLIRLFGGNEIIPYVRISCLLLPLFMATSLIEAFFRGKKQFARIGALQISTSLFFVALIILFIRYWGVHGALLALIIYYVFSSCLYILTLLVTSNVKRFFLNIRTQYTSELSIVKSMIIPMFLLSFVEAPLMWFVQVLIKHYDSYESIASLTAIMQIRNLMLLIPTYFFSAFTSFASTYYAKKQFSLYFQKFNKIQFIILTVSLLVSLLSSIVSPYLLRLYGTEYSTEVFSFVLCMLSLPFLVSVNLYKVHMMIMDHQKYMLLVTFVSSIFYLGLVYLLLENDVYGVEAFFWGQLMQILILYIGGRYIYRQDMAINKWQIR